MSDAYNMSTRMTVTKNGMNNSSYQKTARVAQQVEMDLRYEHNTYIILVTFYVYLPPLIILYFTLAISVPLSDILAKDTKTIERDTHSKKSKIYPRTYAFIKQSANGPKPSKPVIESTLPTYPPTFFLSHTHRHRKAMLNMKSYVILCYAMFLNQFYMSNEDSRIIVT